MLDSRSALKKTGSQVCRHSGVGGSVEKRVIIDSRGFQSLPPGTPVELIMSKRTLAFIDEVLAPCASLTRGDVLMAALIDERIDLEQPIFCLVTSPEDVPKSVGRPLTVARESNSAAVALFVTQEPEPGFVDEILQDPVAVCVREVPGNAEG
jgi:hypothetical protein